MSSSPDISPNSFQIQVLDGNGVFNSSLTETLNRWSKQNHLRDFYLVSVMGAQSSGKSLILKTLSYCYVYFLTFLKGTLLNKIFNTHFSVMNEEMGRSRTTVGTWLENSTIKENGKDAIPFVFVFLVYCYFSYFILLHIAY